MLLLLRCRFLSTLKKLVKWVSRITHITDYPETNQFLHSLNKGDYSEAISPQLLLLIYILEALIINDKGYNYGKIVPVLYSSSKMLPGFIKGGYLYKHTVITTSWTSITQGLVWRFLCGGVFCFGLVCFRSKLVIEAIHSWPFSCIPSLSHIRSVLQSKGFKTIFFSSVNM